MCHLHSSGIEGYVLVELHDFMSHDLLLHPNRVIVITQSDACSLPAQVQPACTAVLTGS